MADISLTESSEVTVADAAGTNKLIVNSNGSIDVSVLNTASGYRLIIDPTGSIVQVPWEHYMTHQGLYFFFQDYATGIGNGSTRDVLLITANNGKGIHMKFGLATLGGSYALYEAPTTTANGGALTIVNKNRGSANTATLTAFSVPTVTAVGTLLVTTLLGASSKAASIDVLNPEIVLKPNTKYLVRFSSSAGSNISSCDGSFYEV